MSYIMFQSNFTRELIDLGYQDGMAQSNKLVDFLHGQALDTTGMTIVMRRMEMKRGAAESPQEQRSQAK